LEVILKVCFEMHKNSLFFSPSFYFILNVRVLYLEGECAVLATLGTAKAPL